MKSQTEHDINNSGLHEMELTKQFIFLGLSFAGNFPLTGLNLGGAVTDTAATRTTHATSGNKKQFSIRKNL